MNKDIHNIANNYFTLLTEAKKPTGKTLTDKKLDYYAENPYEAAEYARDTLQQTEWDKIPGIPKDKAQKIIDSISKDAPAALVYANQVMKRRWPEAEPTIATDGMTAAQYVIDYDEKLGKMVGKKWSDLENIDPAIVRQAEENIVKDADDIMLPTYIDLFTNRWNIFENIAFTDRVYEIEGNDPNEIKQYYINHLKELGYEDED